LNKRRFVLLDRDGTVIVERHYLSDPEDVELLPGVVDGLKKFRALGFGILIVTNQSAVGRGYIDETRLAEIHARMNKLLENEGGSIDGIYYCPHHPDSQCDCRKPQNGLPLLAAKEHNFQPEESIVIGDKECDIELGHNINALTFLVLTGYGKKTAQNEEVKADFVVADLIEAANIIENQLKLSNGRMETVK
jgi:D-glycero-D-manno-heptose 1,7-bisphosphate phosphatase